MFFCGKNLTTFFVEHGKRLQNDGEEGLISRVVLKIGKAGEILSAKRAGGAVVKGSLETFSAKGMLTRGGYRLIEKDEAYFAGEFCK